PRVRHENALGEPERQVRTHLLDALQCRGPRLGDLSAVPHRRDITEAQSGIIVARPDDPVEVDLDKRHQRGTITISSPTWTSSSSAASGSIATPFFGSFRTLAQQARKSVSRPLATIALIFPPSAISPTVSSEDSRIVRMSSVSTVTVGPPSKMST